MIYLGIDTSCYTTSVAAVNDDGQIIARQRKMLAVPEGQRGLRQSEGFYQHINAFPDLYNSMLKTLDSVPEVVAVSANPRGCKGSYMPVFNAGVKLAEVITASTGAKLFLTDHQRGHIAAALYGSAVSAPRFLAVHLSGGTTEVLRITMNAGIPDCEILLATADISAGQLIDRVGVACGFSFPAGRFVDELAISYTGRVPILPAYVDGEKCSFSGTEAAAMRALQAGESAGAVSRGVMQAVTGVLAKVITTAALKTGLFECLISGGVGSSKFLRASLQSELSKSSRSLRVYFSDPALSADNACGVALLARTMYRNSTGQ